MAFLNGSRFHSLAVCLTSLYKHCRDLPSKEVGGVISPGGCGLKVYAIPLSHILVVLARSY